MALTVVKVEETKESGNQQMDRLFPGVGTRREFGRLSYTRVLELCIRRTVHVDTQRGVVHGLPLDDVLVHAFAQLEHGQSRELLLQNRVERSFMVWVQVFVEVAVSFGDGNAARAHA